MSARYTAYCRLMAMADPPDLPARRRRYTYPGKGPEREAIRVQLERAWLTHRVVSAGRDISSVVSVRRHPLQLVRRRDEWSTPQDFFDALDAEFHFTLDAAASRATAKCPLWFGPEMGPPYDDALALEWWMGQPPSAEVVWLNPPYSQCRAFMAKAAEQARKGCTVVCLVPSRTDTRWWAEHVWNTETHQPRPGVEIRFIKGRLKFGGATAGAPFPSVVIIFRPVGR